MYLLGLYEHRFSRMLESHCIIENNIIKILWNEITLIHFKCNQAVTLLDSAFGSVLSASVFYTSIVVCMEVEGKIMCKCTVFLYN
jgi:hypothetical protein